MDLFISHSYLDAAVQQQLRRLVSAEVVRSGFDLMTAEFASDFHQRTLNRCTSIPISHLPRLLLSSRRITTSPIIWAFNPQTVAYSQVQRFHSPQYLAGIVWTGRTVRSRRKLEGPLVHHAVQLDGEIHLVASP